MQNKLCCLIAAAGKGTRANLPYPKTLYKINGQPILFNLLDTFITYDQKPTIVVSPDGEEIIKKILKDENRSAYLVVQERALGMGNAVLKFSKSPAFVNAQTIILAWGDIPFLQKNTISELLNRHKSSNNTFTFASRKVNKAYTIINRDLKGNIKEVIETRENNLDPCKGEREIGLFIFEKEPIFKLLREDLSGKFGKHTNEHGFLYIIKHLITRGYKVEALDIAKEIELISLNKISDLK